MISKENQKTIWQHFIEEKDETERDFKSLMEIVHMHTYIYSFISFYKRAINMLVK